MYDSLNQTILSLSPDDRIRIILKKPLKSLRARFLKIGKHTNHLYLLENSKLLKVLTHVSKGDTQSGYSIMKPKGDFITDYIEISKQKFCILTKDGYLSMFNTTTGQQMDTVKLKSKKFQGENIDHVSIAVCPKGRFLAVSACTGFPKGSLKKYSISFVQIKGRQLKFVDSVKVFDGCEYTNQYSLEFYPVYLNQKPVLYASESGGNYSISSFTLEDYVDDVTKKKMLKVIIFKKEIQQYHGDVNWSLLSDGNSLWSIDDSWNLKNLIVSLKH